MRPITSVSSAELPESRGHYSQAVVAGGLIFISGQLAIGDDGSPATGTSIESQMRVCLQNLELVLKAANATVADVVKTTIYVSDIRHWKVADSVYGTFFGDHRPARAVVPTDKLHYDLDVEIDAVALVRN